MNNTKSPVAEYVETRGRKRKPGDRYPSGKLKGVKHEREETPPMKIRRALDQVMHEVSNPLFGTAIGRLLLRQEINEHQYSAGIRFAEIEGRYRRIMGFALLTPKSPSFERSYVGHDNARVDQKRIDKAKEQHEELLKLIGSKDHKGYMRRALDHVCVDDLNPEWEMKFWLLKALTLLAEHFGFIRGKRTTGA